MDRLTAAQVFVEVANSGSFSAAADKLDISRAMVTRYVEEMEKWLGARLLQRTTRRVTLTDAGETCLRRAQQMLELMENMEDETTSSSDELRGQLRLTCSTSFAYAQVASLLNAFLKNHPLLKIDLNVSDGALNLVESRIDLAIRISNEPDPMLIARPLAKCESFLVASPDYLAQHGTPKHPKELAKHRCMTHAHVGKNALRLTNENEEFDINIECYLRVNETTILLRSALSGGGIVMLPTYLVNAEIAQGNLRIVLPDWRPPSFTIYALYPSRRQLAPAVRALLDFFIERFAVLPW